MNAHLSRYCTVQKITYKNEIYSKNGQVNQQASADRPVSSLLGLVRTLQLTKMKSLFTPSYLR